MNKEEIKKILEQLFNAGLLGKDYNKAVDGIMGPRTRNAMEVYRNTPMSYQEFKHGFEEPMLKVKKAVSKAKEYEDNIQAARKKHLEKVQIPLRDNSEKNKNIDLQTELYRGGFYPMGLPASVAIDGYIGGKTKEALNKRSAMNTTVSTNAKEPKEFKEPTNWDLYLSILGAPILGAKQSIAAYKDGYNKAVEELKLGNLGKAAYSSIGAVIDATTAPATALGLKIAPSWVMPFKDIVITGINRTGRKIFKDPDYTAVKGRTYTNADYTPKFNAVAEKMAHSNGDGHKNLKPMILQDVNPNLDYGSSKLLLYPFNSTAGYSWTIGSVSPQHSDDEVYFNDPYDNSNRKTNHYLTKNNPSITDLIRGIGGIFTSHEEEPNEGKQHSRLTFKK